MARRIERLLVGIDGSANGQDALQWAIVLAEQFGAELLVVHAVGLLDHLETVPVRPRHHHLDEVRRAFEDEWCAPLRGLGVAHRRLLQDGSAVPVLLEVAEREAVDVIVVGSHGHGAGREFLLGSTSHQVAEQSGRPVFIVPPAAG